MTEEIKLKTGMRVRAKRHLYSANGSIVFKAGAETYIGSIGKRFLRPIYRNERWEISDFKPVIRVKALCIPSADLLKCRPKQAAEERLALRLAC